MLIDDELPPPAYRESFCTVCSGLFYSADRGEREIIGGHARETLTSVLSAERRELAARNDTSSKFVLRE